MPRDSNQIKFCDMINGFYDQTHPLTETEQRWLPIVVAGLKLKIGKENVISSKQIMLKLIENKGITISGPRLRKLINHIRTHGLVRRLIATSNGYFVATSDEELKRYVESLNQRIQAIEVVKNSLQAELNLSKNGTI